MLGSETPRRAAHGIDQHPGIRRWVEEISSITTPDRVVYCDGSDRERDEIRECLARTS